MATGNHFWLDCLAGIGVALLAMRVVYRRDCAASLPLVGRKPTACRPEPSNRRRTLLRSPDVSRAAAIKDGYTTGARALASRSMRASRARA